MKVLLVHTHYQQLGGEYTAVAAQTALLQKQGHTIIPYIRNNNEIEQYGLHEKAAFFPNTVFARKAYKEIQDLVAQERPHLAHIHNVFPTISPAVYYALKRAHIPIVQSIHNFRFLCPNGLFYTHKQICECCKYGNTLHAIRWQCYRDSYILSALYALTVGLHRYRGAFQYIDRFIVLAQFTAQKFVESGLITPDKISVLGNFLPDPLPVPGSFEKREPFILFLGRLSPEKGLETLLDAMTELPFLKLKIAGDGPEKERLQRKAVQHGMHHVEFLGLVAGEAKWDLLREAMVVVMPSAWYEHFPFAILESLAAGTPIIASDLGNLPYIVQDNKSGFLFEPGNCQDLREKLMRLVAHPEVALEMGRYGRSVVETQYSATAHYQKLMQIYTELNRNLI
jgi:glycosyltransferase involved in cell wall biosynthesis